MSDNPEEAAYYLRFIALFIDLGTETVLKVFYYLTPKTEVKAFFLKPEITKTLKSLCGKKNLSNKEYKLVSSSNPNPDHFDISLLITLLTNLYSGKLAKPKNGWGTAPGPGDISISDDLVRLRDIRNAIIAHQPHARLVRGKFEHLWNQVEEVLVRLVQQVDATSETALKEKITTYKDRPLDLHYRSMHIHLKKLREWWENCEEISKLQEKVEDLLAKTQDFFRTIPEKYTRYIKLLSDGGRFVLQGVLDDEQRKQNNTLEEILLSNKDLLKEKLANDKMFEQLFLEKDGETVMNTDTDTWDIAVLAVVIINAFPVDDVTAEHVTVIMGARIQYADNALVALDSGRFNICCEDLISSIRVLSSRLDKVAYNKCKEVIADYRGDSPVDDVGRFLEKLAVHGSQIKTIADLYEETLGKLKTSVMKMEEEGIVFKRNNVCELKMVSLGNNKQKLEVAEDILETVWQAALAMSDNPTKYEDVRKALDGILGDIRKLPDIEVEDYVRQCILLRLKCHSWRGLLLLIEYIESPDFQQHLQDIAEELNFIVDDLIQIFGYLTFDSIMNILNDPYHVEDTVTLRTKTDVQGYSGVFDETANMTDYVSGKKQGGIPTGVKETRQELLFKKEKESGRHKSTEVLSLDKGSEDYFEYSCGPCNTAGDHVEAQGFCTNCNEYLCGVCLKSHSRSKTSRHHILTDKDNLPKMSVKLCDPCKTAGDEEEAAGYCTDCGDYLCGGCFRSHSRTKASRQHVLLDKDNMPVWTESDLTSSVAKMNISGQDSQQYNEEYTYIRDINVKTNEDKEDCYITDMTLVTTTKLILTDCNNKSLKLVDLENNVIKDSLRLQTFPSGLTTISQDQVAVVLHDKCKIQIISVSGGLSVVRTLKTNGYCLDIKYINGKLYVSFDAPVKFQILQLTGAVYKTINPDSEVLKHCTLPLHIAVSTDESMIYISDWKTNKVMCMGMNGRLISMYQDELDEPCDITISPSGSVYLCNTKQHAVYKMTSDLSDVTVILVRGDGLMFPHAMCFNVDKQHLYISSGSADDKYCNALKLYKWK